MSAVRHAPLSATRAAVSGLLYPLLLGGGLLLSHALYRRGLPAIVYTGGVVIGGTAILLLIERWHAYTELWRPTARSLAIDLTHSAVSAFGVQPLVRASILTGFVLLGEALRGVAGVALWPTDAPLPLQLVLALLIADFGAYWAHRLMHTTRLGWRLHAVHHSPTRLNVMAAGRTHPFNAILTLSCEGAIVLFLGIPAEAYSLLLVYKALNGQLQHANIDLRTGPLSYVLATNDLHWWHHSRTLAESDRNFGNSLIVWDLVFGTFFLPRDRRASADVGLADAEIPERYLSHLGAPFLLSRYEKKGS